MRARSARRVFVATAVLLTATAEASYTKLSDVRRAMDDGVVLAADVYVPTAPDTDGDGLYPCVVELTPYRKESRYSEGASYLPGKGIALIEVDARGTGGSAGEYDIVFSVREQADAVDWIDWAATTATKDGTASGAKLCEETVGMYGGSYSGIIQYLVASLPPTAEGDVPAASPYLATVAPQRAYGDLYRDIVYHGGIVIASFGLIWSGGTSAYYTQPPSDVFSPAGLAAWTDHLTRNDPMILNYLRAPYSDATFTSDDSPEPWTQRLYEDSSMLPRIENLRVPTLHLVGFYDAFTRGQLLTFQRALAQEALGGRGPNFLIAGPWNHSGTHFIDPDQGYREFLGDWYAWWLEGKAAGDAEPEWITNGLDGAGARVRFFQSTSGIVNASTPADGAWVNGTEWPLPGTTVRRLYLRSGGLLSEEAPATDEAPDTWVWNPSAGTGEILSRWDNAAGTPQPAWDQRTDEPKGISFTTAALPEDLEVAGPIALRLWAATDGLPGDPALASMWPAEAQALPPYHDVDFVVKLTDVAPDGASQLVTQGYLRASHRAYDPAESFAIAGEILAPYHLHTLAALEPPVPGEPREYLIEIWPTAKTFPAGHRLRIDIYSADTPNHITLLKPALNTILHDSERRSYLALPIRP